MLRLIAKFPNKCFRSFCQFGMVFVLPATRGFLKPGELFATLEFSPQHFHDELVPMFLAGNLIYSAAILWGIGTMVRGVRIADLSL